MKHELLDQSADRSVDALMAILDQSQDCIKLIGQDGRLEFMNPNGRKAMAIDDFDDVAGRNWQDLWPEESRAQIEKAVEAARRGEKTRFEGFCPTARGEARWWDVSVGPIRDRGDRITHILATSRDITLQMNQRLNDRRLREDAQASAERSDLVSGEMRHRLKNLLAVVGSVSRMISRNAQDVPDFRQRLDNRLAALARAQNVLIEHRYCRLPLRTALDAVLDDTGAGDAVELGEIADVEVGEDQVENLALILNELQTNALKYGALLCDDGQITVTATKSANVVSIVWHEDCRREITPSDRQGGGHLLVQRLGSVHGMTGSIAWHPHGITATFHLAC